ncbi:hypothetical protein D3C84_753340 [compost metagenome]
MAARHRHGALEDLRCIRGPVLGHVRTAKEIQALGVVRLRRHRPLQALGHFFHRLRRLGELTGQFDLVAGTEMQVQPQAQQRHQHGGEQRQGLAQARLARRLGALGVGQQLTGGFGAAGVQLRGVEHALLPLGLQLSDALLVQRHVERGTVLFALGTATTQHRNQQKTQGNQEQQTCGEPEINHSWFYPTVGRGAGALRRKACPEQPYVAPDDDARSRR